MRIGILASGGLGETVAAQLLTAHDVIFIMTDAKSSGIIRLAENHCTPLFTGNPRGGRCASFIRGMAIDVLLSVNYLFLIEQDLYNLPGKLAFNIHGSLLPRYRGRTPHVWSIINNEQETGITAHLIDSGCDTGRVIEQVRVPIGPDDTGASILSKFQELYMPLINSVLHKVASGEVMTTPQDESKATYFGKRTPEDGGINWNWHKERIRNWVRAQAYPYPGAFSHIRERKIIIDEVCFDDFGFQSSIPDGMILSAEPFLVKTPNGVIRISKLRDTDFRPEAGLLLN